MFNTAATSLTTANFNVTIGRDLTFNAFTEKITAGSSTVSLGRNFTMTMASNYVYGTSTFIWTGSGATIGGFSQDFYNLTINAGVTVTTSGGSATINVRNILTMNAGSIVTGAAILQSQALTTLTPLVTTPTSTFNCRYNLWMDNALTGNCDIPVMVYNGLFTYIHANNRPFINLRLTGNTTFGGGFTTDGNNAIGGGNQSIDNNGFNFNVTGNYVNGSISCGITHLIGATQLNVTGSVTIRGMTNTSTGIYRSLWRTAAGASISIGGSFTVVAGATFFSSAIYIVEGVAITVGGSWTSTPARIWMTQLIATTVQFTAAGAFAVAAYTGELWPRVLITGGGSTTLPNDFNCYDLQITAGLVTAGTTLVVTNTFTNAGTFTSTGSVSVGSSFVNAGTLILAGSNIRCTGSVCSVSGVNPVTLSMAATCGRMQLLTNMNITGSLIFENRLTPGVVQFLAGGTYNVANVNSQIAYPDAPVQLVSSIAGVKYVFKVTAVTSIAYLWPRDNDATGGIALVGNLTNKDLGGNVNWTLNTNGQLKVITEDAGQDLLAMGSVNWMKYCWIVSTSVVNLTAAVAAFLAGANNWHRSSMLPMQVVDNLNIGSTYYIALGIVDDRNNRVASNVGAGDYVTGPAVDGGGGGRKGHLHVNTKIGSAA